MEAIMTTLWDTTGTEVVAALSAERRAAGALAFGLALTLVVVVDERNVKEAEKAATTAAAAHPCRLLIVVRREVTAPQPRLDAEVSIGGRLGPGEAVITRMYGRLALHAESVVLPLLAPDAPVITWWHGEPPERISYDPLGVFADRRVTETVATAAPLAALRQRAVDFAPGDTDVAWTRITPWRTLIAAAYDSVTEMPSAITVTGDPADPSTALLAGWFTDRLGAEARIVAGSQPNRLEGVALTLSTGELTLRRQDSRTAVLSRPGQPDRALPLPERDLGDLLAEELRRLDDDPTYGDALSAWSGIGNLNGRSPQREHVWRDPMAPPAPPAPAGAAASGAAS
jgi:glucose-6-phosphate dehydrogenase assembly protein OpcA